MTSPVEHRLSGSGSEVTIHGVGTTAVPNVLLDRIMPTLRDTEFRILMVVVRQTLGWQDGPDPAKRKEKDWLTQSQLMRRTGRANGAVSHAVDGLVRAKLIDVLDRWGKPLATPAERRRHLGHLYYRLHQGIEAAVDDLKTTKIAYAKAHTTKESRNKNRRARSQVVDKSVETPVGTPVMIRTRGWERVKYSEQTRWE